MNPHPLSTEEWRQIMAVPAVREAWVSKTMKNPAIVQRKCTLQTLIFSSGSPGYFGDLFILQGDALTGDPPMVLRRGDDGTLLVS